MSAQQRQCRRPFAGCGIVDFGTGREKAAKIADASRNQNFTVRQERGGMCVASLAHRACRGPDAGAWIEYLGAGEGRVSRSSGCLGRRYASAADDEDGTVRQ